MDVDPNVVFPLVPNVDTLVDVVLGIQPAGKVLVHTLERLLRTLRDVTLVQILGIPTDPLETYLGIRILAPPIVAAHEALCNALVHLQGPMCPNRKHSRCNWTT